MQRYYDDEDDYQVNTRRPRSRSVSSDYSRQDRSLSADLRGKTAAYEPPWSMETPLQYSPPVGMGASAGYPGPTYPKTNNKNAISDPWYHDIAGDLHGTSLEAGPVRIRGITHKETAKNSGHFTAIHTRIHANQNMPRASVTPRRRRPSRPVSNWSAPATDWSAPTTEWSRPPSTNILPRADDNGLFEMDYPAPTVTSRPLPRIRPRPGRFNSWRDALPIYSRPVRPYIRNWEIPSTSYGTPFTPLPPWSATGTNQRALYKWERSPAFKTIDQLINVTKKLEKTNAEAHEKLHTKQTDLHAKLMPELAKIAEKAQTVAARVGITGLAHDKSIITDCPATELAGMQAFRTRMKAALTHIYNEGYFGRGFINLAKKLARFCSVNLNEKSFISFETIWNAVREGQYDIKTLADLRDIAPFVLVLQGKLHVEHAADPKRIKKINKQTIAAVLTELKTEGTLKSTNWDALKLQRDFNDALQTVANEVNSLLTEGNTLHRKQTEPKADDIPEELKSTRKRFVLNAFETQHVPNHVSSETPGPRQEAQMKVYQPAAKKLQADVGKDGLYSMAFGAAPRRP